MTIAGREIEVHLAKFAATEGDVWLYDLKARFAIVGDLVVDSVPFMDTACPDGWTHALEEIDRTDFTTLIPGHGPEMTRADSLQWKTAFANFIACGRSSVGKEQCIGGWERDAAGSSMKHTGTMSGAPPIITSRRGFVHRPRSSSATASRSSPA